MTDINMEIKDEVFEYLEELRDSGETNMFGAGPYLMQEFSIDKRAAQAWLTLWMGSF